MEQAQVIERIKALGKEILPEGSSLWLYGSRARGTARPDSDYDLLILLDKDTITSKDFNSYVIPLCDFGDENNEEINPHIYSRSEWNEWWRAPFYKNVEEDKVVLI